MKSLENPQHFRAKRNEFIKRSFRDIADQDYISARLLHRNQLLHQFLWAGLQAIEKYLKAILLFHDEDTRDIKHDLNKALLCAEKISKLGIVIPQEPRDFIQYLGTYGKDRYFTHPTFTKGWELFLLDRTVWYLRRYCDDFYFPHENQRLINYNLARLKGIQQMTIESRKMSYRLDKNGFLETVLDGKHPELRPALVWKNFFFADKKRKTIPFQNIATCNQPANLVYPEILEWAESRVSLPNVVKEEMRRRLHAKK